MRGYPHTILLKKKENRECRITIWERESPRGEYGFEAEPLFSQMLYPKLQMRPKNCT